MPGLAPGFSFMLSIFDPAKVIFKFGERKLFKSLPGYIELFERKTQRVTEPCLVSGNVDLEIAFQRARKAKKIVSSFRRRTVMYGTLSQTDSA